MAFRDVRQAKQIKCTTHAKSEQQHTDLSQAPKCTLQSPYNQLIAPILRSIDHLPTQTIQMIGRANGRDMESELLRTQGRIIFTTPFYTASHVDLCRTSHPL